MSIIVQDLIFAYDVNYLTGGKRADCFKIE